MGAVVRYQGGSRLRSSSVSISTAASGISTLILFCRECSNALAPASASNVIRSANSAGGKTAGTPSRPSYEAQTALSPSNRSSMLASMLDLFDGDRAVCASYEGREGVPAVFPPALFADLMTLDADAGAKALLHSLQNKIKVDMPEAAVDIDTLDDLKRLPPW